MRFYTIFYQVTCDKIKFVCIVDGLHQHLRRETDIGEVHNRVQ